MKKKAYMKPVMSVVRIQQHFIICTSPDSLDIYGGDPKEEQDDDDVII